MVLLFEYKILCSIYFSAFSSLVSVFSTGAVTAASVFSVAFFFPPARRVFFAGFLRFTLTLTVDFVEINQFNHCRFSMITGSLSQFDDTGITTGTSGNFFSYCSK